MDDLLQVLWTQTKPNNNTILICKRSWYVDIRNAKYKYCRERLVLHEGENKILLRKELKLDYENNKRPLAYVMPFLVL